MTLRLARAMTATACGDPSMYTHPWPVVVSGTPVWARARARDSASRARVAAGGGAEGKGAGGAQQPGRHRSGLSTGDEAVRLEAGGGGAGDDVEVGQSVDRAGVR